MAFDNTSKVWEGSILASIFIGLLVFVVFVSCLFVYGFNWGFLLWTFVSMLFVILAILIAARANSAMTYINSSLNDAKPNDYKDVGTRQAWIDWTKSTRLAFTLFGLEITYSSLIGAIVTIVSTLFVAIFTSSI